MKDRIIQVMEQERLTPSKFAEVVGIQRSAMSHIISGRNNQSLDVVMKIRSAFPHIDTDWLLFGKGSMIHPSAKPSGTPDLFANMALNRPEAQYASEYRREMGVKPPQNDVKQPETEIVMTQKLVSKKITKIMIFYSDETFETFVTEKSKKE